MCVHTELFNHPASATSVKLFNSLPSATAKVELSSDQFAIVKYLGSGAMGTVFQAQDRITRKRVALKVVKKSSLHEGGIRNVINEQQVFVQNVGNLHAVQLYASFHDTVNFYMVMVSCSTYLCQWWLTCSTAAANWWRFATAHRLHEWTSTSLGPVLRRRTCECSYLLTLALVDCVVCVDGRTVQSTFARNPSS